MVFAEYAHYYDLLYKDKDYKGEADYINSLVKKYHSSAKTILDLGCGTGKHAEFLSGNGYIVHGVDMSFEMLKEAEKRKNINLSFSQSSIEHLNIDRKFDVITSLFHVMSYQTKREDLEKSFVAINEHLNDNGVLIFDCWYGPAVLTQKPEVRVKHLENELIEVMRIAEPVLHENENIVDVNYHIFIKNKKDGFIKELKEKHVMRYFFVAEIENLFLKYGFNMDGCFEFMTNKSIGKDTWGVCFVGRKNKN